MSLTIVDELTQNLRAFNPLETSYVEAFLPGLSSTVTKVASGDVKATMKVRVAMVELWQVILRNVFSEYEKRLQQRGQAAQVSVKRQMLDLSSPKSTTVSDPEADEDEFSRLADCFNHLSKFLYRESLE